MKIDKEDRCQAFFGKPEYLAIKPAAYSILLAEPT